MRHLLHTLLLGLALVLALSPAVAVAGDAPVTAPASSAEEDGAGLAGLSNRLFILEHQLHALEAELMALRKQLAALEADAAE